MGRFTRLALAYILTVCSAAAFGEPSTAKVALPEADAHPIWMKVKASTKFDRTKVIGTGVSIEVTGPDYVMVLGDQKQAEKLSSMGLLEAQFPATQDLLDFPNNDANFHNYDELKSELQKLASAHPQITVLDSIGKSVEGRDLMRLRISADPAKASQLPAALIMGGHHAREHVSVEVPLMFAQKFLALYDQGDSTVVHLVQTRDIQIVPLVNPDGAEYDIEGGSYKTWRKNRALNSDGSHGVDINRNYAKGWDNVEGASSDPGDDTFHGLQAFSEPETRAVKDWVDSTPNAATLLTLHSFSELVLYPWGSQYDPIADSRDQQVFKTMAKQMASWNGYEPMQASQLYLASGDTCDWAYSAHKIFAFTFELDPSGFSPGGSGFYPGQASLPAIFDKNWQPMLYMIDLADNPYRSIEPKSATFGNSLIH